MRRLARIVGTLMIVAGLGALAWAFTVWKWQDPVTAVLNRQDQRELSQSLDRRFEAFGAVARPASPSIFRESLARDATRWRKELARGDAVGRLRVPRLDLNAVIVNGTDTKTLKRGPGRYLGSSIPGEGELVYVAGHRTTYGAPFSQINELRKGDRVYVDLPYATIGYRITGYRIVAATQLSVLKSKGYEQLALQACHPRFFATQRYIAYAKPVEITPAGGGPTTRFEALG